MDTIAPSFDEFGPRAGDEAGSATDGDVAALCRYLRVNRDGFEAAQDAYFTRLGELLTFHGVATSASEIDSSSFRAAVRSFQQQSGLADDGIPGESTLWELNSSWALANQLDLVRLEMDDGAPAGVTHVDSHHGYLAIRVRSDVAEAVDGLRADLNAAGVPMTSSGATRSLDAAVTAGRSSTSIHYSAAAVDLATTLGMTTQGPVSPDDQPYLVTEESGRWRVWARSEVGDDMTLDVVEWSSGSTNTRSVAGRFFDVTSAAESRGLGAIGPKSSFPSNYLSAEWWHFQSTDALIPWASQFGSEVLRLSGRRESDIEAQQGLWAARKRILHRGTNGWW